MWPSRTRAIYSHSWTLGSHKTLFPSLFTSFTIIFTLFPHPYTSSFHLHSLSLPIPFLSQNPIKSKIPVFGLILLQILIIFLPSTFPPFPFPTELLPVYLFSTTTFQLLSLSQLLTNQLWAHFGPTQNDQGNNFYELSIINFPLP